MKSCRIHIEEIDQELETRSFSTMKNIPKRGGVYFIMNDSGEVIYIGQSQNLKRRLATHSSGKAFPFVIFNNPVRFARYKPCSYSYIIEENRTDRLILELLLIDKHRPDLNSRRWTQMKNDPKTIMELIMADKVGGTK